MVHINYIITYNGRRVFQTNSLSEIFTYTRTLVAKYGDSVTDDIVVIRDAYDDFEEEWYTREFKVEYNRYLSLIEI